MLRLNIEKSRVRVRSQFFGSGSVLAETIETSCRAVETVLEIESREDPVKISKLARLAETGCYVIQSLRAPVQVNYQVELNGRQLPIRHDSDHPDQSR